MRRPIFIVSGGISPRPPTYFDAASSLVANRANAGDRRRTGDPGVKAMNASASEIGARLE
jgi:hypothetical protein